MTAAEEKPVRHVAVIGTGTIGASWAALFLSRGLIVRATDPAPDAEERLYAAVDAAWETLEALGAIVPGAAISNLSFLPGVAEAVALADFVQENGPEDVEAKASLFAEIDAACPQDTPIASSTSALTVTPIQARCRHPGRCLNAHPFNPPHLIPLVELSGGKLTEPETLDRAEAFYRSIGRSPVRLNREVYGHIANRLQYALYNEAVRLVLDGVASVADVDAAVTEGLGVRWLIQGPFLNYQLAGGEGGLRRFYEIFEGRDRLATDRVARATLTAEQKQVLFDGIAEMIGGASTADLRRRRDERLVEVLKLRRRLGLGER